MSYDVIPHKTMTKLHIGALPELGITFHLHYISFALHLKILPRQHKMHDTSRFKCHALHLHFMK